ncbi:YbaK/EbsC family protein [Vibrio sp. Of14-4]|uniref:aminoacyl-tRNA deacylase n=1 Tax=Vibrio sp. Of14-4 TaxID=2724878 RepID=UPI001EF1F7ED|nr:YbaK/EbsC family protein [Vibrio sp. Of14-4]MCG7490586.1 YbaK/EbsC family protein [Vibrio sp. Of14-4]
MTNSLDTTITRYLNAQRVSFRVLPHQSPATTIEDAAKQRGILPEQMVKCILLRDMGNLYALACIPGDRLADPRRVRSLLGCRRMTCVDKSDIEKLTGYQVGTVTPLLLPTKMSIIFDHRLMQQSEVTISSGSLLAGLSLQIDDLFNLCNPVLADICR